MSAPIQIKKQIKIDPDTFQVWQGVAIWTVLINHFGYSPDQIIAAGWAVFESEPKKENPGE